MASRDLHDFAEYLRLEKRVLDGVESRDFIRGLEHARDVLGRAILAKDAADDVPSPAVRNYRPRP